MKAAKKAILNGIKDISLSWVPGHCNIAGNSLADALAKQGCANTPQQYPTSLSYTRQENNKLTESEWVQEYLTYKSKAIAKNPGTYAALYQDKLSRKFNFPLKVKRKIASAFFQLKIGHGYFKSYRKRIRKCDTDRCSCNGTAKQTPRHLLLECSEYRRERREMLEELGVSRPTMAVLLNTKKGINITLKYIEKTKIATREWYTEREDIGW